MTGNMEIGGRLLNALRITMWGTAAALLLLPLVAMRFTREVNWTGSDFVFAGVMLGTACGAYELAVRTSRNLAYLVAFGIAIGTAFLLIWVNAAVGIVGDGENPLTLLFAGVVLVAIAGGAVARLRPARMALAMLAAAAAQLLAGAATVAAEPRTVLGVTVVFATAWLVSAWLFRAAARAA